MVKKTFLKFVMVGAGIIALSLYFSTAKGIGSDKEVILNIYRGWNVISSPSGTLDISEIEKSCRLARFGDKALVWAYDQKDGWTQPAEVGPNEAVFILSLEDCEANLRKTIDVSFAPGALKGGWNLIAGTGESFEEMKGNCEIIPDTGIWGFNPQTQQYNFFWPSDRLGTEGGYWIGVKNDCELSAPKNPDNKPLVMLFVLKNLTVCGVTDKDECSELKLSDTDIFNIKNEANQAMSNIRQWTNSSLDFRLKIIEIPPVNAQMTAWTVGQTAGWALTPETIKSAISPFSSKELPDFILLTHGMYDEVRKKAIPPAACGLTFNARAINGATYIWVPKTQNPGTAFECAHKGNYVHELLNGLNYSLERISQVEDIYSDYYSNDGYPLCGKGDPDTFKWFPFASGDHEKDPDYGACGKPSYCKDMGWGGWYSEKCNLEWHKHILEKHYNPKIKFIGNHCRDGIRNFGEVSTDRSTDCDTGR